MSEQKDKWQGKSSDYRRGWIEGYETGVKDAYLLETGAIDAREYLCGFQDGYQQRVTLTVIEKE